MVPEETEEQKEKRWRAEQLAQLTAVESQTQVLEGESDMHMRELITNSERKINQLQLRDEHVKFDAPAEVQLLPAKQTSERVHGANSYYQCTKPVEMGAVSNELKEEMEKVLKHVTIKNYQWYDSTTFEVNAQHVRSVSFCLLGTQSHSVCLELFFHSCDFRAVCCCVDTRQTHAAL